MTPAEIEVAVAKEKEAIIAQGGSSLVVGVDELANKSLLMGAEARYNERKSVARTYHEFNPQQFVGRWDTPILVIHGGKDFRVPEGQGMEAFGTAQLRGIPSRFLYFPNEGHWIGKPQNSVLWNRVFFDWLGRTLKPEGSAAK
jgi:dipeptidyl aminopeptidase/acylaminoacyl peptidase